MARPLSTIAIKASSAFFLSPPRLWSRTRSIIILLLCTCITLLFLSIPRNHGHLQLVSEDGAASPSRLLDKQDSHLDANGVSPNDLIFDDGTGLLPPFDASKNDDENDKDINNKTSASPSPPLSPTFTFPSDSPHSSQDPYTSLRIPRIIHITIPSKKHPPPTFPYILSRWKSLNPTFTVKVYDDADMLNTVKHANTQNPGYLSLFKGFERNVERADFWRYLVVYMYGGVYVDSDVEPLQPVDIWDEFFDLEKAGVNIYAPLRTWPSTHTTTVNSLLYAPPLIQGIVGAEVALETEEERIRQQFTFQVQWCQWAFAFRPRHPFLKELMDAVLEVSRMERDPERIELLDAPLGKNRDKKDTGDVMFRTGPGIYSIAVQTWLQKQSILATFSETSPTITTTITDPRSLIKTITQLFIPPNFPTSATTPLRSIDIVHAYDVVGSIGFLPPFGFGHRFGTDGEPDDGRKVFVAHRFAGSWKHEHVDGRL